MERAVVAH